MKVKTVPVEAKSDNPEIQKQIDAAVEDHEHLTPTFNKMLENLSAGGIKRLFKALVTFQDVKFKGDEFELMSLAEHLLKGKLAIMISAAKSNEQAIEEAKKESHTESNKGEEHGV